MGNGEATSVPQQLRIILKYWCPAAVGRHGMSVQTQAGSVVMAMGRLALKARAGHGIEAAGAWLRAHAG